MTSGKRRKEKRTRRGATAKAKIEKSKKAEKAKKVIKQVEAEDYAKRCTSKHFNAYVSVIIVHDIMH